MIALIASALLGLYILIPVLLFDKILSAFVPAKRVVRTRTEEIFFGLVVAAVPLFGAFYLAHVSWYVGHHPFPLNESTEASAGKDYKVLTMALQSDTYLDHKEAAVWTAAEHIKWRQLRFLTWTYALLAVECFIFTLLVYHYGRLQRFRVYRWLSAIFIRSVSEWHVLLTTYTFHPSERRTVHLDVLARRELYTGIMRPGNYFFNSDGSLSGVLLSEAKRFRRAELMEDRKNNCARDTDEYWRPITGPGKLYLPVEEISNINIRYVQPKEALAEELAVNAAKNAAIQDILQRLGKTLIIQVSEPDGSGKPREPVDSN